jgi:hypothetical protein
MPRPRQISNYAVASHGRKKFVIFFTSWPIFLLQTLRQSTQSPKGLGSQWPAAWQDIAQIKPLSRKLETG